MHGTLSQIVKGEYSSFYLISGPCAVESYSVCAEVAKHMKEITSKLQIPYIFKASFKKANRTKLSSFSGLDSTEALRILKEIKEEFQIAITTDIHEVSDVHKVSGVVDLLQIPAFLCRQTDLLVAAGKSGLPVNVKKGQFMSGESMRHAVAKVNEVCFLTERGNSFGYQDLIVDGRNIHVMSRFASVVMDCTHSTQRPNQTAGITGGNPEEVELFARIGLAAGAKGLFIETHPDPASALSDGASMLPLFLIENSLQRLRELSLSINAIHA